MLSDQRQFEISELILKEGKAYINDLAKRFRVSDETIRRDLNVITADGRIKKVHGGAIAVRDPISRDADYQTRRKSYVCEKREIGRRAASLIQDHDIIGLDTGTCIEALARELYHLHDLCIITASLPIAVILAEKIQAGDFDGRVILLGGTLSQNGENTYGPETLRALSQYHLDKAFLSATAFSQDGLMLWNENDGAFSKELHQCAAFSCVLAESEKLGKHSFYRVATPDEIDRLITDDVHSIDDAILQTAGNAGLTVEIVSIQKGGTCYGTDTNS